MDFVVRPRWISHSVIAFSCYFHPPMDLDVRAVGLLCYSIFYVVSVVLKSCQETNSKRRCSYPRCFGKGRYRILKTSFKAVSIYFGLTFCHDQISTVLSRFFFTTSEGIFLNLSIVFYIQLLRDAWFGKFYIYTIMQISALQGCICSFCQQVSGDKITNFQYLLRFHVWKTAVSCSDITMSGERASGGRSAWRSRRRR